MKSTFTNEVPLTIKFLGATLKLARKNTPGTLYQEMEESLLYRDDTHLNDGFFLRVIVFSPNKMRQHFEAMIRVPQSSRVIHADNFLDLEQQGKEFLKSAKSVLDKRAAV